MGRHELEDEVVRRALATGSHLGGQAEQLRTAKAVGAAKERAKHPAPPTDPNLPRWWEYELTGAP